ncbi:hypothetical protein ACDZ28_09105 [Paenibacillus sp. RS8]|uniref:hypothetical protein n=1 Tax=Paenibacillus TaxID=44249 RepID=UPI00148270B9|nr:hypothetical protein [Paenibacillus odorifer]
MLQVVAEWSAASLLFTKCSTCPGTKELLGLPEKYAECTTIVDKEAEAFEPLDPFR